MTENLNLQPEQFGDPINTQMTPPMESRNNQSNPENGQINTESITAYKGHLDQLGQSIPEIVDNRPAIETAGTEMIDKYGLTPELFADESRSLLFVSMASRWAGSADKPYERVFLEDALTLLSHDYSPKLKEVYEYVKDEEKEPTDTQKLESYDKYTDKGLTSELKVAIENGLLDDIKTKLGITPDNEDPYELRVLQIGDMMTTYGMDPPSVPHMEVADWQDPEKANVFNDALSAAVTVGEWKKGLYARGEDFAKEVSSSLAPAWITVINGQVNLCLQMPTAEKLLRPSATEHSTIYGEGDRARDVAYLEHEYTHTQGGINIDRGIDFGISIEELRAEEYSGNKHGYNDIKNFARDLKTVTGKDLINYLEDQPKGGDRLNVYTQLARDIGLDRMLEVVMVRPRAYDQQSNLVNAMIANHLGGFDGVIGRVMEYKMERGQSEDLEAGIDKTARSYMEKANPDFLPTYFSMRRGYGNELVTSLVEQRIKELQTS